MKSIKYISLFALSFFALSCSEKLDDPWSEAQKEDCGLVEMTFSTTIDIDNEQTRTVLVDGTDIYFQSTDHISIFDGAHNNDFTASIPGGASRASKADFTGVAASADTYYALYPYTSTATLEVNTIKGVNIPSEQTAVASTFAPAANPSVCVANRRKLNLKNVGAYLKFTVPSGKTYSKVVVISNDGGAIAGTVNVTVSPTGAPVIDQIVNPSSKVTLTGTMEAGSTYYVVVLPTALTGGLTMQFYNEGELLGNKSSNNALTVTRAKVKDLGTVIPVPPVVPEVVPGEFTINSDGVQIQFAKGNLQYQASTNTWKFADAQYIALGQGGGNQTQTGRDTQANWIDLFGWGCTGIRHENMTYSSYQPWTTSTDKLDYYKQESQELSVENYTDWGCLFSDNNNEWFTLSKDEWEYLNNSRPNRDIYTTNPKTGSKRPCYAYVLVDGVPGDLYFADDWTYDKWPSGVTKPTYFNYCGSNGRETQGSYTAEQFKLIEATGVVFFPITGYRNGVTVGEGLRRPGGSTGDRLGLYWTRTQKEDTSYAIWAFASGDGRHPNTAESPNDNSTAIGTNIPGEQKMMLTRDTQSAL